MSETVSGFEEGERRSVSYWMIKDVVVHNGFGISTGTFVCVVRDSDSGPAAANCG